MTTVGSEALPFSKMSGGGNDFIVVDNRAGAIESARSLAIRLCTRRLGVGADGMILIEESSRADFRMRFLNADGSQADFCANGTRCAARFALLHGIASERMSIESQAGIVPAEIHGSEVRLTLFESRGFIASKPLQLDSELVSGSFIIVGVPHYVTFVSAGLWALDIEESGYAIRHHEELQPEGANANYVSVINRHQIHVRTWERGVEGETMACGSGVVSSVIVCSMFEHVDSPVDVLTRSGITLRVEYEVDLVDDVRRVTRIALTGDARLVFESVMTPDTISGFDPDWVRDPTKARKGP